MSNATTTPKETQTGNIAAGSDQKTPERIPVGKILESKVFALALNVAERYTGNKRRVYDLLQHAFEKLKNESRRNNLLKTIRHKINVLGRMLNAYIKGTYRHIPTRGLVRITGGLIYFVWILDFIPDFIPLLGLADDIAVILWVYDGLNKELEDFEQWESSQAININD